MNYPSSWLYKLSVQLQLTSEQTSQERGEGVSSDNWRAGTTWRAHTGRLGWTKHCSTPLRGLRLQLDNRRYYYQH